jgi:GR25 family glycosyltransferase involved in LPS biosynthesis
LRPAYDGKQLQITPSLAKFFAPNDFFWKKSVLGCALSHLSLWVELASEKSCENYLILEDDVKFHNPLWLDNWKEAASCIPEDYDILYLGGVLPPNKDVFLKTLDPVNPHWARIAPNCVFGQPTPTPQFHFCNYAYIISQKGAQKLLEDIGKRGGYTTSADHMLCGRYDILNYYVATPLLAGCYQDSDPKYQTSQFNDFSRIDTIDSDLWNNDDRFSELEVRSALQTEGTSVNILQVLQEARIPPAVVVQQSTSPVGTRRVYTAGTHRINHEHQMELRWLCDFLGPVLDTIETLSADHEPLSTNPIFIVARPHMEVYQHIFNRYEAASIPFYVIHLSDEYTNDPIEWYSYEACKGVLRNYVRQDCIGMKHVYTIPLGPNRRTTHTKEADQRSLVWSFFGTKWHNREKQLQSLLELTPNSNTFYDAWLDPKQIDATTYSDTMLSSKFIPCPRGQHVETFRFWEALEHGAIPIYVREPGDTLYFTFISSKLPILSIPSWEQARGFIQNLLQNTPTFLQYRKTLLEKWLLWKQELVVECKRILAL